jgi:hypothetical protein
MKTHTLQATGLDGLQSKQLQQMRIGGWFEAAGHRLRDQGQDKTLDDGQA